MAKAKTIMITLLNLVLFYISVDGIRRTSLYNPSNDQDDGICKSMVETQGYSCEEHKVTTEDGYILSMQRIPSGGPPVLLQHGLMMDAGTWLLSSPDEALAFILADNGFDVWLANTRGTDYSRGHTSLDLSDPTYWDWSWDELVAYDLPASCQYVYNQTAQKLHYVGHSLGTLIALAAFSQDNLLINMLRSGGLLSPIAYLGQIESLLAKDAAEAFIAEDLYWLGVDEFAPRGKAVVKLMESICKIPGRNCSDLMSSFTGPNCCVNSSKANDFLSHEPQSTSTKNMIHLAQMIRQGRIAKYDYGSEDKNNQHYGQPTPPEYKMSSIPNDFPLFFSYGGQDYLSDVKDVQILLDNDLNAHQVDKLETHYVQEYAHADFVFGVNAKQDVYNSLMDFFGLHN